MNWVLEHMEDADFNDPLPIPGTSHAASPASPADGGVAGAAEDPATLMILTSLGFTERQAQAALKATNGDAERGADWLFSHTDNLDAAVAEVGCRYGSRYFRMAKFSTSVYYLMLHCDPSYFPAPGLSLCTATRGKCAHVYGRGWRLWRRG